MKNTTKKVGGIQTGQTAFDNQSRLLDSSVRECRNSITVDGFEMTKQLTKKQKQQYFGGQYLSMNADGGLWWKDGKLVAVFEAKKQNLIGNAHERWYDNATTAKAINPNVKYVTFITGSGVRDGGPLWKLSKAAPIKMGSNFLFYSNERGFTTDQISNIMLNILHGINETNAL